jgi:hypothetical protein
LLLLAPDSNPGLFYVLRGSRTAPTGHRRLSGPQLEIRSCSL